LPVPSSRGSDGFRRAAWVRSSGFEP